MLALVIFFGEHFSNIEAYDIQGTIYKFVEFDLSFYICMIYL